MDNSLNSFGESLTNSFITSSFTKEQREYYFFKQTIKNYVKLFLKSESEAFRRAIIPNYMDFGKFIDFQDSDEDPAQLNFISVRCEYATLNIVISCTKRKNNENFSLSPVSISPQNNLHANIFWGFIGEDLHKNIIRPYAATVSMLAKNFQHFPKPEKITEKTKELRLVPKTRLLELPTWHLKTGEVDPSAFERKVITIAEAYGYANTLSYYVSKLYE